MTDVSRRKLLGLGAVGLAAVAVDGRAAVAELNPTPTPESKVDTERRYREAAEAYWVELDGEIDEMIRYHERCKAMGCRTAQDVFATCFRTPPAANPVKFYPQLRLAETELPAPVIPKIAADIRAGYGSGMIAEVCLRIARRMDVIPDGVVVCSQPYAGGSPATRVTSADYVLDVDHFDTRIVAAMLMDIAMGIWGRWGQLMNEPTAYALAVPVLPTLPQGPWHALAIQVRIRRDGFLRHVMAWSTGWTENA